MPSQFRSDLPAIEVDRRLQESLRDLREAEQNAVLWFAEVYRRHLYRDLGFGSIHQYAALRLGFGKTRTSQFIRLSESLKSLPKLEQAVSRREISWSKAREVATVATPATEAAWIEEARTTTSRALEDSVRRTRAEARSVRGNARDQTTLALAEQSCVAPAAHHDPRGVPVDVHVRLSPEEYARYEAIMEAIRRVGIKGTREGLFLAALEQLLMAEQVGESAKPVVSPRYQVVVQVCEQCERGTVETSRGTQEIPPAELRAILCDARVRGGDGNGGRSRSSIPPRLRKAVLDRDRHRCRLAGCGSARFLNVHHAWPHEHGGADAIGNLFTLCAPCHRALHESDRLEHDGAAGGPRFHVETPLSAG